MRLPQGALAVRKILLRVMGKMKIVKMVMVMIKMMVMMVMMVMVMVMMKMMMMVMMMVMMMKMMMKVVLKIVVLKIVKMRRRIKFNKLQINAHPVQILQILLAIKQVIVMNIVHILLLRKHSHVKDV